MPTLPPKPPDAPCARTLTTIKQHRKKPKPKLTPVEFLRKYFRFSPKANKKLR